MWKQGNELFEYTIGSQSQFTTTSTKLLKKSFSPSFSSSSSLHSYLLNFKPNLSDCFSVPWVLYDDDDDPEHVVERTILVQRASERGNKA